MLAGTLSFKSDVHSARKLAAETSWKYEEKIISNNTISIHFYNPSTNKKLFSDITVWNIKYKAEYNILASKQSEGTILPEMNVSEGSYGVSNQ